ncbi:hypothetical protein BH09ACT10_BH09ACT10_20730 [soil metagenome]
MFWRQDGQEYWFHGYGYYFETYAKLDGRWVFTSRRVERIHVRSSPGAEKAPMSDADHLS